MIADFIKNWCEKHSRKFIIYDRAQGSKQVYLIRYVIFKCKWFGVYLHEFFKSDEEVLHDHPWDFVTLILKGSYKEEILSKEKKRWTSVYGWIKKFRTVKKGQFLFRKAKHIHRVILTDNNPITLSVLFRKKREWGFWEPIPTAEFHLQNYKWKHWRDFLNIKTGENKKQ